MAISYNSNIVTSGLVLCVDAGNPRSYPGSGTSWRDATSSGFNFTLINGPTYSSSNLGFFTFGVDDIATAGYNTALDIQTPSVEVWVKTNATTQNGFWFEKGSVNSQYALFQEGTQLQWRMGPLGDCISYPTANTMTTNVWYQVVATRTSGSQVLYINGVSVASGTQTGTLSTSTSGMSIGAYGGNSGSNGYFYNGALSICRVYNRVLSAAEVLQNFNAARGRYGI